MTKRSMADQAATADAYTVLYASCAHSSLGPRSGARITPGARRANRPKRPGLVFPYRRSTRATRLEL